jgi:pimeloyl-ACP methyl ester carboxylesterase
VSGTPRELEVDGARLAVREWGEPGGRPILLWQALGPVMTAALYGELEPALQETGSRLVAPDAPGFGASAALPPERYAIGALVELLWRLADELRLERPVLAGHSWGGVIASAAAAARPVDTAGLVLFDSGHRDYQDDPSFAEGRSLSERTAEAAARRLRLPDWDTLWAEMEDSLRGPLTPSLRAAIAAGVYEESGEIVGIATPEAHGAALHGLAEFRVSETWPALGQAEIPVLLLLATEPPELRDANRSAASTFAAVVPQVEPRFVPNAGHSLLTDAPAGVNRPLADWLRRLPGPSRVSPLSP